MNRFIKPLLLFGIILVFLATTTGCGSSSKEETSLTGSYPSESVEPSDLPSESPNEEKASVFYSFQDDNGTTVTLAEKPERIVILTPQFLPMLYELGGEAVGYATSSSTIVPKGAEHVQQVGTVNQINVEQLTALNPDLVIGSTTFDEKLIDLMQSNDIPLALMRMASFDDVKEKARLIGKIIGAEEKAEQLIRETEEKMEAIRSKLPQDNHTFAVLNVTTNSISIQRTNTTALEIGELLNMTNIAKDMNPSTNSSTSAPYSIEAIVAEQPDYIFIVIHGSEEKGMERIKEELEQNPAWASLQAVKEKRAHVLPANQFLSNPGFAYEESMEYMAKLIYPEIFGHVEH